MDPILHEKYPLSKRKISQLQYKAQLTPSPQGFSSLPRVSEAFNTTLNPPQKIQGAKSNASKSNMLIYIHNNYYIHHMQHINLTRTLWQSPLFKFQEIRKFMA